MVVVAVIVVVTMIVIGVVVLVTMVVVAMIITVIVTMVIAMVIAVMIVVVRKFAVVGSSVRYANAGQNRATEQQRDEGAKPLHSCASCVARNSAIGNGVVVGMGGVMIVRHG